MPNITRVPAPAPPTVSRAEALHTSARAAAFDVAADLIGRIFPLLAELEEVAKLELVPAGVRGEFSLTASTARRRLESAAFILEKSIVRRP